MNYLLKFRFIRQDLITGRSEEIKEPISSFRFSTYFINRLHQRVINRITKLNLLRYKDFDVYLLEDPIAHYCEMVFCFYNDNASKVYLNHFRNGRIKTIFTLICLFLIALGTINYLIR